MKRRILIVDDEVNFTWLVKLNLEETGEYVVFIENDSRKALTAAKRYHPDLILLDVILPGLEGPDVLSLFRCDDDTRRIPVVFFTATVRKEEVDNHHGVIGGQRFLAKPSSISDLIETIEKNLFSSHQS